MKTLLMSMIIGFMIFTIISCNQNASNSTNAIAEADKAKAMTQQVGRFTLNGIPFLQADTMIRKFLQSRGSYDKTALTSLWFPKSIFSKMDTALMTQGGDGIRIYFAKTKNGKYTFVLVSTFYAGVDPTTSFEIHRDYFQLKSDEPYLGMANVNGVNNYDNVGGDAALYTSNPNCPSAANDGCDTTKPHYITCQTAFSMVNSFGSDSINATSEWFDSGIIKDLDSAINVQGGDGLRIYFARELKPKSMAKTDTVHMHGVVLITTKSDSTGKRHKDYFDCFVTHPAVKSSNKMHANLIIRGHAPVIISGGTNNGEQCPTNCSGTTWP